MNVWKYGIPAKMGGCYMALDSETYQASYQLLHSGNTKWRPFGLDEGLQYFCADRWSHYNFWIAINSIGLLSVILPYFPRSCIIMSFTCTFTKLTLLHNLFVRFISTKDGLPLVSHGRLKIIWPKWSLDQDEASRRGERFYSGRWWRFKNYKMIWKELL
jgi:hypothetical protein